MSLLLHALWKSYGGVNALLGVDLTIRKGEFFTLLGPSGCGKTTMLRLIAGLELPDSGQISLEGKNISQDPANRRPFNTVFQSYALFPHLSVLHNVAYGLLSRKVPKAEALERSRKALDMVRLVGFEDRMPHQMSGGQRQRVAIARALVNEPEVLLLDEPMSALDAKLRLEVQVELRQLQQRLGRTFVMVTHDQQEALTVSDRIAVMEKGRIAQVGTAREVYDHPVSRFVAEFLGTENFVPAKRAAGGKAQTSLGVWDLGTELPWDEGQLTIRPEKIRIVEPGTDGAWRTEVSTAIYRGGYQVLHLANGLHVETDARTLWRNGDVVWGVCPPESLVVLHG